MIFSLSTLHSEPKGEKVNEKSGRFFAFIFRNSLEGKYYRVGVYSKRRRGRERLCAVSRFHLDLKSFYAYILALCIYSSYPPVILLFMLYLIWLTHIILLLCPILDLSLISFYSVSFSMVHALESAFFIALRKCGIPIQVEIVLACASEEKSPFPFPNLFR